jgi:hypothetical protein
MWQGCVDMASCWVEFFSLFYITTSMPLILSYSPQQPIRLLVLTPANFRLLLFFSLQYFTPLALALPLSTIRLVFLRRRRLIR